MCHTGRKTTDLHHPTERDPRQLPLHGTEITKALSELTVEPLVVQRLIFARHGVANLGIDLQVREHKYARLEVYDVLPHAGEADGSPDGRGVLHKGPHFPPQQSLSATWIAEVSVARGKQAN